LAAEEKNAKEEFIAIADDALNKAEQQASGYPVESVNLLERFRLPPNSSAAEH